MYADAYSDTYDGDVGDGYSDTYSDTYDGGSGSATVAGVGAVTAAARVGKSAAVVVTGIGVAGGGGQLRKSVTAAITGSVAVTAMVSPMTRSPIATSAPAFATGASYFPVDTTKTTLTGAIPTNAWFENFLVGTGYQPINVFPYEVKVTTAGLDICVPNLNTSSTTAVLATMLQNFSFRAAAASTTQKVTAFTDLGCTITWNNGMVANIVRGMAYVTMNYTAVTPVLNSQNAITAVNGVAVGATGTFTGTKFKFALNNGQTWLLYADSSITLALSTANTLTAGAAYTGRLKLALLPTAGDEATFDTYSTGVLTGGSCDYTVSGNTATEVYTWTVTGNCLIYSMPHHQDWLSSPNYPGPQLSSLRGQLRAVAGSIWTLSIPLPVVGWNNANAIDSSRLSAITTAFATDKNFVPTVSDPYFGGKQLAKAARLILIADQLGDTSARTTLLNNLKPVMNAYITGTALRYDTVWGGIVSAAGLTSQDADFGNGRYNDHHFHYGYAVYTAAVISKFDTSWQATYTSRINDLLRDFMNPAATDPYFTPMRAWDWYEGHSWAAGNFEFGDNRNQESTSEAVNAWYGVYLWGLQIGNAQIRDMGRLLFAQEVATAQKYWQIKQADTIYPATFKPNGVVGILWSNKVDYATFFGAQAEYIHGIQMLPITPATEVLIPDSWITETWTNNLLPLWTRTSVWRAELVSGGAGYVPAQFSQTGQGYTDGLVATGGSGSGLGFNVNITGGSIIGVYIIFNQHGSGYADGQIVNLNGSGGSGATVRVYTQPEDGWKAVLLGAYSQINPADAWTRTIALSGFDDGSSKTQALVHIATQTLDVGTSLSGSAVSVSSTSGALGISGGAPSPASLSGSALSVSTTTGTLTVVPAPDVPPVPGPTPGGGGTPIPTPVPVPSLPGTLMCDPDNENGVFTVAGVTPNGNSTVTREVEGMEPFLVRGGLGLIKNQGFVITDPEAPLGRPVTYRATISGVQLADRLIQENLILTPTFAHGVNNWTAGPSRSISVATDSSSNTGVIGLVSANLTGSSPAAPPTLVSHIDTAFGVNGTYTLTPPTTGGTAVAAGDWMVLIHQQVSTAVAPVTPAGWTLISDTTITGDRQMIWTRKRLVADAGVTVAASSTAASIGTLLWVRGAMDDVLVNASVLTDPGLGATLTTGRVTSIRPALVISAFTAKANDVTTTAPTGGSVTGGTWQYTRSSGTNARTLVVATTSQTEAGDTDPVTTTYSDIVAAGVATQVVLQVVGPVTSRVIAATKAAPMAAAAEPYLITGRVKFTTPALWTWQDVKDQGTWQNLLNTKGTWLAVRGSASSALGGGFLRLFVTIVDPATGADYIDPIQVLGVNESSVNRWLTFAAFFTAESGIPATAEIRLSHGTTTKEYPTTWSLDEFGITPGWQRAVHATRYWFDGDSPVPANPEDYLLPGGTWDAGSDDAAIVWNGLAGNSVSTFYGPSVVSTSTTCFLDSPVTIPCEPVLLSDPVDTTRRFWAGLISLDELTHPANRALFRVLDRPDAVSVNQVRGWEEGSLMVQTDELATREEVIRTFAKGRVLLLRNPNQDYPENNWYISVGDVGESRVSPDGRKPYRFWSVPYVRVARPTGDIEKSNLATWADVKAMGTWADVRAARVTWLGVATGRTTQ